MSKRSPAWRRYLRFWGADPATDIDDELRFHLEMRTREYVARGMSPDEAQRIARERFGNVEKVAAESATIATFFAGRRNRARLFDDLRGDVKYALRSFRRAPAFAITAFLTLSLGIASLGSVFSYMNAVYFAALPYRDANRIVAVAEMHAHGASSFNEVSAPAFDLLAASNTSFERIATYQTLFPTITFGNETTPVAALAIDTSFIPLFGLRPEIGRLIAPEEISANAPVAMVSDALWRAQLGADTSVLHRRVMLDSASYVIVGVLPIGFRFPWRTDLILPLHRSADTSGSRNLQVIAKLRPGATRSAARAAVAVISNRLPSIDVKKYGDAQFVVRDEMLDRRGNQFLPAPSLFLAAGFFVLLIACANVINLFLARAARRRGEMAIRASLGGTEGRLLRQALTETMIIGLAAAIVGTMLSSLLVRLWLHFVPQSGFPSWFHLGIDLRIVGFAVGSTLLVTLAVGLVPAREGTRVDLVRSLKQGGDAGTASKGIIRSSKRGLVVQLALSVALFIAAALLLRSFRQLTNLDVGYPATQIATVAPFWDPHRYADDFPRMRLANDIAERVDALSGVRGAAVRGDFDRLRDGPNGATHYYKPDIKTADDRLIPDGDTTRALPPQMRSTVYVVSDGYFDLLGLHVRAGRNFNASDNEGATPSTVVSAALAKVMWGAVNPIGHTIQRGRNGDRLLVVGVVDDVRDLLGGKDGFGAEHRLTVYVSTRQGSSYSPEILGALTTNDPAQLRARMVDFVRAADPSMVLFSGTTLASQFDEAYLVTKVFGAVIAAFASGALLLAVVGIYGVVAFGIVQRTREIGIRVALGGTPRDVLRMLVGESLRFAGTGIGLGLVLSIGLGRFVRVFLAGVSPLDPLTYAVVIPLFALTALVACYIPARRATRIDPLSALRVE